MQVVERIGRRLKLRDLNIFLAVVKERSMSKAAAVLAISQPAVSKSIADMEHMLGAPLLDRTPRGIEPTTYGQALIRRGLAVFDELRQSVRDIESLLDPTVGEVRIGCGSPLAAIIVAAAIERLNSKHPRLSFTILEADLVTLQRELGERNIEIAIGPAQGALSDENMNSEFLFFDRLLVVTGRRSKWFRQKAIKLADLLGDHWIFPYGILTASLIADAFRAAGVDAPPATVSSRSPRLNDILLASGRFLTIYPESALRLNPKHLPFKALPVELPSPPRPVILLNLKNRTLSPMVQLFISCVREVIKPLARGNSSAK
jgi:DNA-binding transcriptional LysR family regulator